MPRQASAKACWLRLMNTSPPRAAMPALNSPSASMPLTAAARKARARAALQSYVEAGSELTVTGVSTLGLRESIAPTTTIIAMMGRITKHSASMAMAA